MDSYVFNTHRGPFTDPRLRRAVNYAIDRPALAQDTGFGHAGRPTDQYIPPGIPGFEDAAIYPLDGPDLAAARRLAGDERHHAVLYTCDFPGCIRNAQILRSNLEAIGIDLEVQQFPSDEFFAQIAEPASRRRGTWRPLAGSSTTPIRSTSSTPCSGPRRTGPATSAIPASGGGWRPRPA